MATLFENLDPETADTYQLVLHASGIGCQRDRTTGGFRIDVPDALIADAQETIGRYLAENAREAVDGVVAEQTFASIDISGVAVAMVLLAAHAAVMTSAAPGDYVAAFGAQARLILQGQWYRCATALLLHADAAHLAGNMAGMALFGGSVSALTGTGVGWLLILACGILGNFANAMVVGQGHLSVGASTAVFGAVGILCAMRAVDAIRTGRGWKRIGLILGVGAGLLAFLGSGERSDLGAHLFGLLAGAGAGSAYGWIAGCRPAPRGQLASGILATALLLVAWLRGMVS